MNPAFRSRSGGLGHAPPLADPPFWGWFDHESSARLVTHPSHGVIQVTARYAGLVGDPPLCWNSRTAAGFRAQRAGAQRSAEWRREGEVRRSLTTTMGRVQRPTTPTPSRRSARGDAWSRGCDASAGTFQEGWHGVAPAPPGPRGSSGGSGAARRERPRLLGPARPEARSVRRGRARATPGNDVGRRRGDDPAPRPRGPPEHRFTHRSA